MFLFNAHGITAYAHSWEHVLLAGVGAWVGTKLSAWETQQKIELDQMLEGLPREAAPDLEGSFR